MRHAIWIVCLSLLLAGCLRPRKAAVFLLPEHYVGWVRVEYGVAGEQPLPLKDGHYVVAIPSSGFLRTSSPFEEGYADDHYYTDVRGKRTEMKEADQPDASVGEIRARRTLVMDKPGEKQRLFGAFFVGSQSEYLAAPRDPASLPLP